MLALLAATRNTLAAMSQFGLAALAEIEKKKNAIW